MLRTSTDLFRGEEVLICPVCGFEHVHPIKVKVVKKDKLVIIDSNGLQEIEGKTEEASEATSERGVRIILEYYCEDGHHGNIIFQFHKGITYVYHENLPPDRTLETLWRD